MRADRLVAVLLLLQARGRVTAADIAAELEVSERTARRDLEALAMSGVPVYSTRGRGGGWRLVGGAKTDLTGLKATEAQALLVAANTAAAGTAGASGADLGAALRKLIQAIPQSFRPDAEAVARTFHVDPVRWAGSPPAVESSVLDTLQTAVIQGRQVELGYRRPGAERTDRTVHPFGLVTKAGVWYLVGGTDRGRRTFRVSRVEAAEVLEDPADRPDDFDLEEAWASIKADFGSQLRAQEIVASAIVEGWVLSPLRTVQSTRLMVGRQHDDGRFEVELAGPSLAILAYAFAGFGRSVEVIAPRELRDRLGELGRELVDDYRP